MRRLLAPLLLTFALGAAATDAPAPIGAAALRGDLALLHQAFDELHPGLHRYQSPRQLAAARARLARDLDGDRSRAEVFLALTRYTAALRCGHTWPSFYNQSEAVAAELLTDRALPFKFRWLERRMVVTRSLTPGLAPGDEVLAIDGVAAATLLREMLPLARADGGNDAKRIAQLEVEGDERFQAFEVYLALLHPSSAASFALRVRQHGARAAHELEVPVMTRAARAAAYAAARHAPPADNPAGWALRYDGSTAVLSMPTWAVYNKDMDWRAWLERAFATLAERGATGLVIDVRGNEGGLEVGDAIAAHLIDAPLARAGVERRVRFREAPEALRPHLRTWDRSIYALGREAEDRGDGWFRLAPSADAGAAIVPAAPRFRGEVAVLIGPTNSSATFQFAELVRAHRLATLVGEPTGGSQRGLNGGALFFLTLPGSGIEVDLPLIGYFPDGPRPDAGVAPDLLVRPTAADLAAGRDPQLAAALSAVR